MDSDKIYSIWNWLLYEYKPNNMLGRFIKILIFIPLLIIGLFQIAIVGGYCLIIEIIYYLFKGEGFIKI